MAEAVDERLDDGRFDLDDEHRDPDFLDGCVHCDEGMIMICPDDLCRGAGECFGGNGYDDKTCFVVCPHCRGENI